MQCERVPWKYVGWVLPYKIWEILYFTEFIAGSQLSWVLQQHGLAAGLKITYKATMWGLCSTLPSKCTDLLWCALKSVSLFDFILLPWCSMFLGLNRDMWWPLLHWSGDGLPPIGKEKYNSATFCLHQVSSADAWVEPGRGWGWESLK